MADFDTRMHELADRANEAKERVHASASATKEKLELQVSAARASTEKRNQQLKKHAAGAHDEASEHWGAAKQNWTEHIAEIRRKADAEKSDRSARHAEHRAERAELDAEDAIAYALALLRTSGSTRLDGRCSRRC